MRIFPFTPLTYLNVLLTWPRLTRQCRFVNLEGNRGNQADIGWYTVSNGECDQVARKQSIRQRCEGLTVPDQLAILPDDGR